jgi:hypothetical protein
LYAESNEGASFREIRNWGPYSLEIRRENKGCEAVVNQEILIMNTGRSNLEALSREIPAYRSLGGDVLASAENSSRRKVMVLKDGKGSKLSPFQWGLIAGMTLLILYFAILTLSNSLGHAIEELQQIGWWIFILVLGFGTQVGLFVFMKRAANRRNTTGGTAAVAASGGVSTTAMVACCMHHVADVLPILGASAAALFLIRYQVVFLALGVISNLIGINIMLNLIQKYGFFEGQNRVLGALMKINMRKSLWLTSSAGAVLFFAVLKNVLW